MGWRASELALRHEAAAGGQGATLLPCFLGDADARLRRVIEPPEELVEDVHLLLHRDLAAVPAVRAVKVALAALFRDQAGVLLGQSIMAVAAGPATADA
jgi:DNA-binding transcriptional LysR family regulator